MGIYFYSHFVLFVCCLNCFSSQYLILWLLDFQNLWHTILIWMCPY
jgi:hypothetical protein